MTSTWIFCWADSIYIHRLTSKGIPVVKMRRSWDRLVFTLGMTVLCNISIIHYDEVIMGAIASQITSLTIVYSTVYSDSDQRKHQSSASLAFVRGIHRGPVNSPHKWPVTWKMSSFDDVIMKDDAVRRTSYLYIGDSYTCKNIQWTSTPRLYERHRNNLFGYGQIQYLNH